MSRREYQAKFQAPQPDRQYRLLSLSRSSLYDAAEKDGRQNLKMRQRLHKLSFKAHFTGSRQMVCCRQHQELAVNRHRGRLLMCRMGLALVCREPRTRKSHPGHRACRSLSGHGVLENMAVTRPRQGVWCTDLTHIPMRLDFLSMIVILGWQSSRIVAWRLSNTLDRHFGFRAPDEALRRNIKPEICNTRLGHQSISLAFGEWWQMAGIRMSMTGGRYCIDKVIVENFCCPRKYEKIYRQELEHSDTAERSLADRIHFPDSSQPHPALIGLTREEICRKSQPVARLAESIPEEIRQGDRATENTPSASRQAGQRTKDTSYCRVFLNQIPHCHSLKSFPPMNRDRLG